MMRMSSLAEVSRLLSSEVVWEMGSTVRGFPPVSTAFYLRTLAQQRQFEPWCEPLGFPCTPRRWGVALKKGYGEVAQQVTRRGCGVCVFVSEKRELSAVNAHKTFDEEEQCKRTKT